MKEKSKPSIKLKMQMIIGFLEPFCKVVPYIRNTLHRYIMEPKWLNNQQPLVKLQIQLTRLLKIHPMVNSPLSRPNQTEQQYLNVFIKISSMT